MITYCLNIHPGEDWSNVRSTLKGPVATVKHAFSPTEPFPIGLRFSAAVVQQLKSSANREELQAILAAGDLLPLTLNAFPYGPFHGTTVKQQVYQPDWTSEERLAYTCDCVDLMTALGSVGDFISISTVPGGYKPDVIGAEAAMAEHLLRAAAHSARLARETGIDTAIALEPEPYCFLETMAEAAVFFEHHLFSASAKKRFASLADIAAADSADTLRRHLGVCYDVCHAAVGFEDPQESLASLSRVGIPVHKLQLSSALALKPVTPAARVELESFVEPVYLHQVNARQADGTIAREADLPAALTRGDAADGEEWRVHFHVPIFVESLETFQTTQSFLDEILAIHRQTPISPHLEIETYTWDVLPAKLRTETLEDAIVRELRWVEARLQP